MLALGLIRETRGQSADWTEVVWREPQVRYLLADMTLNGGRTDLYRKYATEERDPDSREAIRLWDAGARVVNTNDFERRWLTNRFGKDGRVMRVVHRGTEREIDPTHIRLNSDVPWPETNVRYFMADIALGGSIEFYRAAAERDHEMGCLEAVRRTQEGYKIANLDQFERKLLDGKVLITRKDSRQRIKGSEVKLSSDLP